jgi:hypothetical protein
MDRMPNSPERQIGDRRNDKCCKMEDAQSKPNPSKKITSPIMPVESLALDNGDRVVPYKGLPRSRKKKGRACPGPADIRRPKLKGS